MFDLSLGEILIVVIVGAIFIGPKEIPVVIRAVVKAMRAVRSLAGEIRAAFDEVARESGVEEVNREIRLIKGDDGKLYESYDLPTAIGNRSDGK